MAERVPARLSLFNVALLKGNQELRQFGLILGSLLMFLFGIVLPWISDRPVPSWPWFTAAALMTPAVIAPTLLRPFFWVWMRFSNACNWLVSRVALGLVFYGIVLPLGLTMRFWRKDPLGQSWISGRKSYRVVSRVQERSHMEHPY